MSAKGARPSNRLAELGLVLPPVAAPVAAYVPAVVDGEHVHTSGQLPFVDGALAATGLVSDSGATGVVDVATAAGLARVSALNALAAAADAAGGLDRLERALKVLVFVASEPGFHSQAIVANGASELLGEVFGTAHARSAVGVAALPLASPVEVEVTFRLLPRARVLPL